MAPAADPLFDLLKPERLPAVVDIGANPIDGEPPYLPLLKKSLCRVVGFEPQPAALAALNAKKSQLETYLPYAVGDGTEGTLRICRSPGMTSLFAPDSIALKHFGGFSTWGEVLSESRIATRRLDDIAEIDAVDFLKIDVQGSELAVFRNGRNKLARAVAIQTEVSFLPLYVGQPVFGDIDIELRGLGFVPHAFAAIRNSLIAPMTNPENPHSSLNQLLEADIVYVRDFMRPDLMQSEQLKNLTLIAHHCYRSYDLALNCVHHLAIRGAIAEDAQTRYLGLMQSGR
jgi:FkbM family methyltransferase